ncbi:MAG: diaminopimelate epimerase [Synergistaceae bacterium]|nr:diaminopimelate epimerase [Synergistaceae bacterium]
MISFTKMHGNGNDFILLDNRTERFSPSELSTLAQCACRRRSSLGADGILVVENSPDADFAMRLFNADGSEGEMCGNGARCIARYSFEKGIAGVNQSFSTLAGIMKAIVEPPFVDLAMGEVSLTEGWFNRTLSIDGRDFSTSFLWVGVPHALLFPSEELSRDDMVGIGRKFRSDRRLFPDGANVSFVTEGPEGSIYSVTYERGVEDLTDSCGTGSTASAAAWLLRGKVPASPVSLDVINPGGINRVSLDFSADGASFQASLRGRTVIVAEGTLFENEKCLNVIIEREK